MPQFEWPWILAALPLPWLLRYLLPRAAAATGASLRVPELRDFEVLSAGGASFADVTEMTTFHVGLQAHLAAFMAVKDRYMHEPYPAWTAIGITELAIPGGLVEIRVTARLDG